MKTTRLQIREILAWIVLVCAIVLFSVSFSVAQDKKKSKNSEIKIKIQRDENGKKTSIDTTITADQLPALKEYLKDLNIDFDADVNGWGFKDGDIKGSGNMNIHFRHPEMSKEDREAFERDMEKLKSEMKDLDHELKGMHIEMFGFDDNDPENFDLHLKMPRVPKAPMPPGSSNAFYFYGDDDDSDSECDHGKHFNFNFHSMSDDVPDSLNDEKHIILYGAKGEETPVLEKQITTKDGEKIFIFKRALPKSETAKASASMPVTKVKVYPNPGDGKISLSFTANSKGDVLLIISDAKGNE
ncbi:MAG: hypothetical protein ABI763_11695, partial [Bacteroidota bacterium]